MSSILKYGTVLPVKSMRVKGFYGRIDIEGVGYTGGEGGEKNRHYEELCVYLRYTPLLSITHP
jgi:hypothetical protein